MTKPSPEDALMTKANSLYRSGRFRESLALLTEAEEELFDDPDFATLRGKARLRLQMLKGAAADLRRAEKAFPVAFGTRYYLARALLEDEKPLAALDVLKAARSQARDSRRIAILDSNIAIVNFLLGRTESASHHLEQSLLVEKVPAVVLANIGFIFLLKIDFANAGLFLKQALKTDPELAQAHVNLANLHFLRGDFDLADAELDRALTARPEWVLALNLRANVRKAAKKYEKAAALYGESLSLSPSQSNADFCLISAGDCFYELGDRQKAVEFYQRLVDDIPKSELAPTATAYIAALGRKAETERRLKVIEDFNLGVQKTDFCGPAVLQNVLNYYGVKIAQSRIANSIFDRGVANWKIPAFAKTIGFGAETFIGRTESLKKSIDAKMPVIIGEHTGLDGHFLVVIGYDDVKETFLLADPNFAERAESPYVELDQRRSFGGYWSCVILPEKKSAELDAMELPHSKVVARYDEAEEITEKHFYSSATSALTEITNELPEFEPAHRLKIKIIMLQKLWHIAARDLKEYLNAHPKSLWAQKYLGDCYFAIGNCYPALNCYEKTVSLYKDEYASIALIGECYLKLGDAENAEKSFRNSIEIEPTYPYPYLALATILEETGRREEAADCYYVAYQLDPKNGDARKNWERLGGAIPKRKTGKTQLGPVDLAKGKTKILGREDDAIREKRDEPPD